MHICSVITYTPFMAGVKEYEGFLEQIENGRIGWGHKVRPEELEKFEKGITHLEAHNLLIADMDKIGHFVEEVLPKTTTCPHWMRAFCDLVFTAGAIALEKTPIVEAFESQDYERVAYLFEDIQGDPVRRRWESQIYLNGAYGILHG